MVDCDINGKIQWSWILEGEEKPLFYLSTVEPGNSKLVNSKQRVNSKLFLAAFQSVYNINHLLNSKLLAIVNLLLLLKKFTITRFDCIVFFIFIIFSFTLSVREVFVLCSLFFYRDIWPQRLNLRRFTLIDIFKNIWNYETFSSDFLSAIKS